VGEHPLEALDEVAGDAELVGSGLVGVDHPDAGTAERILVKAGLFGIQAREPAHVVAEHDVGRPQPRVGAELEEGEELPAPPGVESGRIVGELADDLVAVLGGPGARAHAGRADDRRTPHAGAGDCSASRRDAGGNPGGCRLCERLPGC
jgi:hypothetical protein